VASDLETPIGSGADSAAARLALKVSAMHAELIGRLHDELGTDDSAFARAAQRLAGEFGSVTAAAIDATDHRRQAGAVVPSPEAVGAVTGHDSADPRGLPSLFQPGHMRRRLDQLVETNRRYGHPFGLAVFDASGPDVRNGGSARGPETVLSVLGAALRDSTRIVDEVFRLEEDAICVLAPNLRTVEGVQMAERLLAQLGELERAGGLRITVVAGVVACPEHGTDTEELLRKADAAMWRARAVGQPVGVGALQDR
jgi:diguanylate cyclase (GGDEF)-like protein